MQSINLEHTQAFVQLIPFSKLSPSLSSLITPRWEHSLAGRSLKDILMSQEVWTESSGTGYEYTVSITVSAFMNIQYLLLEKRARTTLCLISMLFIRN